MRRQPERAKVKLMTRIEICPYCNHPEIQHDYWVDSLWSIPCKDCEDGWCAVLKQKPHR